MSKLNRFGRLVMATLKGDDAEAKRVKIESKAIAAFNAQIAIKEARTLDLKEAVDEAKTKIDLALINNGELIQNREKYLEAYMEAIEELEYAQDNLKIHLEGIDSLKRGLNFIQEIEK